MSQTLSSLPRVRPDRRPDERKAVALFGFGTVGRGFYEAFEARPIAGWEVGPIVVQSRDKVRSLPAGRFSYDWQEALATPGLSAIVEAINHPDEAYELVHEALWRGLDVVSVSKAMLAVHLRELNELAAETGARLLFEGAAGGAIPILRLLRTHYCQEQVLSVEGILNGTSNYVLTRMNEGVGYAEAVLEAQALGFAETDPTDDVDGHDAANKLCLLAWQAFGQYVSPEQVATRGIRSLSEQALREARAEGRKARLVASARLVGGRVEARVAPRLVSEGQPLYGIEREFNALTVEGAFSGTQTFIGRGAGAHPTGSAVLSDLAEIAHGVAARG